MAAFPPIPIPTVTIPYTTSRVNAIGGISVDMVKIAETHLDVTGLKTGFDSAGSRSTSSIISQGQPTLATQAVSRPIIRSADANLYQRQIRRFHILSGNDFLGGLPQALAWVTTLSLLTHKVQAAGAGSNSSQGTMQLDYWVHPPPLPSIVVEWAALIPLTVYLSSFRSDFELAGEVSLRGRLSVGVVPKLWALGGIAKLLSQGEVFLDTASAAGDPMKVYDVQWGSVFPCYNSAAATAVAATAFNGREYCPEIKQDDLSAWILQHRDEVLRQFTGVTGSEPSEGVSDVYCGSDFDGLIQCKKLFGRRQLLNVIVVGAAEKKTTNQWLIKTARRPVLLAVQLGLILGLTGVLIACGCVGSGVLLLIGGISRYCAQNTNVKRSPLYLRNREVHEGCMLVAAHENATIWTLYLGHRGLIDSLLNKPMIDPGKTNSLVLSWFRFAEILQVVAMTFVAGQKGWDGIILLLLVILGWSFSTFYEYNKHAARWLEEEGFKTTAFGCEFPGRTELLGAVQLLSTEKETQWMDGIIAPVKRRDIWLKKIDAIDSDPKELEEQFASLGEHDRVGLTQLGCKP